MPCTDVCRGVNNVLQSRYGTPPVAEMVGLVSPVASWLRRDPAGAMPAGAMLDLDAAPLESFLSSASHFTFQDTDWKQFLVAALTNRLSLFCRKRREGVEEMSSWGLAAGKATLGVNHPPSVLRQRPKVCPFGGACPYLHNTSEYFDRDHWWQASHPCRRGEECPCLLRDADRLNEADINHLYAFSHPDATLSCTLSFELPSKDTSFAAAQPFPQDRSSRCSGPHPPILRHPWSLAP
ncbi:hypothetical protein DIPPA_15506 [Diplonema papillatum]|nr:hypothetical protein DIPPA_17335 [Diplonema papillatum]KAJ9457337.1 hypothetical protein DIPPA_15506 [Diplonema papillatum]